jgi:hypothetical protein
MIWHKISQFDLQRLQQILIPQYPRLQLDLGIASEITCDRTGTTIAFKFEGKARTMRLYAEDAATFTPPELKDQPADVLLLKNTYNFGYQEKALTTLRS